MLLNVPRVRRTSGISASIAAQFYAHTCAYFSTGSTCSSHGQCTHLLEGRGREVHERVDARKLLEHEQHAADDDGLGVAAAEQAGGAVSHTDSGSLPALQALALKAQSTSRHHSMAAEHSQLSRQHGSRAQPAHCAHDVACRQVQGVRYRWPCDRSCCVHVALTLKCCTAACVQHCSLFRSPWHCNTFQAAACTQHRSLSRIPWRCISHTTSPR